MRTSMLLALLAVAVAAGDTGQAGYLFGKGDYAGAVKAAKALTDKDATNVDAWLVMADALIQLNRPEDAWEALEQSAIPKNPKDARVRSKLGDVFVKTAEKKQVEQAEGLTITNFYLDAERMYDEAIGIDAQLADAVFGKAYVNYILSATWEERLGKAKELLATCLKIDPKYGRAHALQANLFYGDKKYAEAATKFEISLKLYDEDPVDFVRYGHCYVALGKPEQAKAAYIAGLKRHPESDLPIRSGLFNLAGRDWKAMVPVLQEATAAAPKSAVAWYYLGFCQQLNGNLADATASMKKAVALDGENSTYLYWMGQLAEKQGDKRAALDFYRKTLKVNPDHNEAALYFAAIAASAGDIEAAEKLFEELIVLAPRNGWVFNNYALILRDWAEQRGAAKEANPAAQVKQRIKRSSEMYEKAAAILSNEAQIQSDTGLLFEYYPCIRDDQKAAEYFQRSLELSDYAYRDAFDGLDRLCRRTKNWELLKEFAEGVVGSIEDRGALAIAPSGGGEPKPLKNETPGLLARAKRALADASAALKE